MRIHFGVPARLLWPLVLAVWLTGTVSAQTEPIPLEPGRAVTSELTAGLPLLGGSPFRSFGFEGRAGVRYEVWATSAAFVPEVRVGRQVGGVTDYLATATELQPGTGAILEVTAPGTERLLILVRSAGGEGAGEFTLMVRETPAGETRQLTLGQPSAGVVGATAESVHRFTATAGVEVEITVRSAEFDTYLEVGRGTADGFLALETDDDGAGGTDSRVYFTPPATGEYLARVTAYGGGTGGAYAIILSTPPRLLEPRLLTLGSPAQASLNENSPRLDDDTPFAEWVISPARGDRIRIDLRSDEFDTVLAVGYREGRRFVELAANDDWHGPGPGDLGDTDSRVTFIAPESRAYVVRVRSFLADERGAYTLFATPLEPVRTEPIRGTLTLGADAVGTLDESDAILEDGTQFQEWRIAIAEPGRYEFVLESNDFDTFLVLGVDTGGEFVELDSNDDWDGSANGTDSRIVASVDGGEYVLRVRPYHEGIGAYGIRARELPPVRSTPAGGRLLVGQTVEGTIVEEDAHIGSFPYQEWVVSLASGEQVRIALESEDFDTYLVVGRRSEEAFMELAEDDDGGEDTNSLLTFVAPSAGDFVIRVRPFSGDGRGSYRLAVTRAP